MACDICGKTGTPLVDLRSNYQTDDIKAMCPTCEKIVNKKCMALLDWTQRLREALTQAFMRERKSSFITQAQDTPKESK